MKKYIFTLLFTSSILINACNTPEPKKELEIISFATLQTKMEPKDDKVHVFNFWATWCAPCVQELPHFDKVIRSYENEVKFTMVSQDDEKDFEKVTKFLDDRMYKAENYLLEKGNPNVWIPMIDKTWSGALPATMIIKGNKSAFFEGKMSEEQLRFEIEKIKK